MRSNVNAVQREPWNKGKIVGQWAPFNLEDIWALGVRLQMESRVRELALFNLGIERRFRGGDLVSLKVRDICRGDQVAIRAVLMQHKPQRAVQCGEEALAEVDSADFERAAAKASQTVPASAVTAAPVKVARMRAPGPRKPRASRKSAADTGAVQAADPT